MILHHLYINDVLFESYTKLSDAFAAFSDWEGRGFSVRLSFNNPVAVAA